MDNSRFNGNFGSFEAGSYDGETGPGAGYRRPRADFGGRGRAGPGRGRFGSHNRGRISHEDDTSAIIKEQIQKQVAAAVAALPTMLVAEVKLVVAVDKVAPAAQSE